MSDLTIWTLDWVPQGPRGFVRDLRLRWACEEAGLSYAISTVPFDGRETNHLADQPFGQVPFLKDNGVEIFESGAGLLYLARKSDRLMPRDPVGEAETLQWTIAALNSIEMVTVPWWFLKLCGDEKNGLTGWMEQRLGHMERVLSEQEWLAAGRFTVADPVDGGCAARFGRPRFRQPSRDRGLCRSRDRPCRIQESASRSDRSFRGGRPEENSSKIKLKRCAIPSPGSGEVTPASTQLRPGARRSPTAPPRSSGCGAPRPCRWQRPFPAPAPGRCG
jgi:glutathione S-transferase